MPVPVIGELRGVGPSHGLLLLLLLLLQHTLLNVRQLLHSTNHGGSSVVAAGDRCHPHTSADAVRE